MKILGFELNFVQPIKGGLNRLNQLGNRPTDHPFSIEGGQ